MAKQEEISVGNGRPLGQKGSDPTGDRADEF